MIEDLPELSGTIQKDEAIWQGTQSNIILGPSMQVLHSQRLTPPCVEWPPKGDPHERAADVFLCRFSFFSWVLASEAGEGSHRVRR